MIRLNQVFLGDIIYGNLTLTYLLRSLLSTADVPYTAIATN